MKIVDFNIAYSSIALTLDDGSVRIFGDSFKSGKFGHDERGGMQISAISNGNVVREVVQRKLHFFPPSDMGHLVQCYIAPQHCLAVNKDGKLSAWGTMTKFQLNALPFDKKIKKILFCGWEFAVFSTIDDNTVVCPMKGNNLLAEAIASTIKKMKKIVSFHVSYDMYTMIDESGTMAVCKKQYAGKEFFVKFIPDCISCGIEKFGDIFVITSANGKKECKFLAFMSDAIKSLNPARTSFANRMISGGDEVVNSIYMDVSFNEGTSYLVHENGDYYHSNEGNDWIKESIPVDLFAQKDKIKKYDKGIVLLESGLIVPLKNSHLNFLPQMDLILRGMPEWADNEKIVLFLSNEFPKNFRYASERIRSNLEIAEMLCKNGDSRHYKAISGKLKRKKSISSYGTIYRLAGDIR